VTAFDPDFCTKLREPWRFVIVDDVARRGSSASGILPLQ
jgi:adenine/guanine phosphoribosyltransferase-like PRPP-binding protein